MLLRQTLQYLPAQFLGPLLMFVAAVAWTHQLEPAEYGVLAYVLAAQELVYVFTLAWWSLYALRFRSGFDRSELDRHARSDNAVLLIAALAQAIVSIPILLLTVDRPTPTLLVATIVLIVTRSLLTHYGEIARTEGAIATYTIAQLAGPAAGPVLSFAAAHAHPTAAAAIGGFAVAQTIGLVWVLLRLRVRPTIGRPDAALVQAALRYGIPVVICGINGWISVNGIRVVVDAMAGPDALGLMSVGWALGLRVSAVGAMLVTAAAFPLAVRLLSSGDKEGAFRQLSTNSVMLLGLLAPITIGVMLTTRPLVQLMIAEPFQAVTLAILPLSVLAGSVRNLRAHYLDQVFLLLQKAPLLTILSAIDAVATLALTFLGMARYGVVGAVAGSLAGALVGLVITGWVAVRRYGLVPPWLMIGRVLIASAAMTLALWFVPWRASPFGLGLEIASGVLLYFAAIAMLFLPEVAGRLRAWRATRASV